MSNEPKKEMIKEQEQKLALLVNSYYFLMEASDIILRQTEVYLASMGCGLIHHVKNRHKQMMKQIEVLKNNQLNFIKDYELGFGCDWTKYEDLRYTAAWYARLVLLIGDRCGFGDSDEKEKAIIKFIYDMESNGIIDHEMMEHLKIK